MEEAIRFIKTYEAWIYLGLGAYAFWEIRKFALAWEEVRGAAFGLERENAQSRLNRSAILLMLVLAAGMTAFILVSFIAPTIPGANLLATPTIDLLATPTITLAASTAQAGAAATPATPTPTNWPPEGSGCIPEKLMLTAPMHGEQIKGKITLTGTVDFPNFGFYKYEIMRPGDPIWHTLQAGREVKRDEPLGDWDPHTLTPGEYLLRLVAMDNQGLTLGSCEVQVRVISEVSP
jgi:hypothetical protein